MTKKGLNILFYYVSYFNVDIYINIKVNVICNLCLNRRVSWSVYCTLVNIKFIYNPVYISSGAISGVEK